MKNWLIKFYDNQFSSFFYLKMIGQIIIMITIDQLNMYNTKNIHKC